MDPISVSWSQSQLSRISPEDDIYDDGYLRIEHKSYYVSCGGTVLFLPRKEFLILSRLARSINRIVPSQALWEHAWSQSVPFSAGSLRVYISHLRHKLQPHGLNIRSLISVGYSLSLPETSPPAK